MTLETLIHRVESRLFAVGRSLLGADGRVDAQDEIERVQAEQTLRRTELEQAGARHRELLRRISDNETAAVLLPSQIENSLRRGKHAQAVRQALELDRIRRGLTADRAELPRLEQTCWSLTFHLRRLGRQLDRLNEQRKRRGS